MTPEQLLRVEMQAYLPRNYVARLVKELKDGLERLGFIPSKRAEGYAFLPMGYPVPTHLRLGVYGEMVTFWVKGALNIEESAYKLGMSLEEFKETLIKGLKKAEEVFRKFEEMGQVAISWK